MNDLGNLLIAELTVRGAVIVGFGDISELPPDVREGLSVGICVAVKYPKEVIRGISDLPTAEYFGWYNKLNDKLDTLVTYGAELLQSKGYTAIAQTRKRVGAGEKEDHTLLPHKTVATRAGIGWIGKSALLVTERYGSMIRLSSILTDAPLETAVPINESKCGNCTVCTSACPAGAVSGKLWCVGLERKEFFDAVKCRKTARERSKLGFGGDATICGKCIEACPYTRRYLTNKTVVREISSAEYHLLEDFLYHALFLPPGIDPLPREVIYQPEIFIYIDGFGNKPGDCCMIAEADGKIAGAAWTRIIPAYGHIDDDTPELAIAVLPEYRGQGIGTALLTRLFELLRGRGYKRTSLSVQKANPAARLYGRVGYEILRENEEDWIMVKPL